MAYVPIEQNHRGVGRKRDLNSLALDPLFELDEEGRIIIGKSRLERSNGEDRTGSDAAIIMKGRCVGYTVTIAARRALYFGRRGEIYVENFPSQK